MIDPFDIRYLIGALRRRWLVIAAPAVFGGAIAVGVAYVLPPIYSASARIIVESQQIPTELARSTVSTNAEQRILLIEERLMTRNNLLDISRRFDVFPNEPDLSPTEIVQRMREASRIRVISASNQRGNRGNTMLTTVEISFRANRAPVTARVTNEYLTQVLARNTEQRSARASETLDFFEREVERLGLELQAIENEIAVYRTENQMSLPESLEFRRSELSSLQRELFLGETRRLSLVETRRALEAALAAGQPTAPNGARRPDEAELERLRLALTQQEAIYKPSHPTIRSLNARIEALEARIGATSAADVAGSEGLESNGDGGAGDAGTEGSPAPIRPELARLDAEIALIDEQRERQQARIVRIEEAIARSGEVGIQIGALERDRASLQRQYNDMTLKRADAATGERLEVTQQAERFEVVEQPQVPEGPVSPNRPLIAGAGGVLSLGFGLALAALLELLNPAIRSVRDLERVMDLRPIAILPRVLTVRELRRRRWLIRAVIVLVIVVIPAALWWIDQYVMPLSVIADRLMSRTGFDRFLRLVELRLGG
jgi:polysaccharide chain length determinant protein (PEP-CTERM system associated)